jgi:hypothetical protein
MEELDTCFSDPFSFGLAFPLSGPVLSAFFEPLASGEDVGLESCVLYAMMGFTLLLEEAAVRGGARADKTALDGPARIGFGGDVLMTNFEVKKVLRRC